MDKIKVQVETIDLSIKVLRQLMRLFDYQEARDFKPVAAFSMEAVDRGSFGVGVVGYVGDVLALIPNASMWGAYKRQGCEIWWMDVNIPYVVLL